MHTLFELKITGTFKTGFRRYVKQLADENNIKGTVEKINQTEITLILQGENRHLKHVLHTILSDDSKALIKDYTLKDIPPNTAKLQSFKILRTKETPKPSIWKRIFGIAG